MRLERSCALADDAAQYDAMAATVHAVIDSDRMIDGEYPLYIDRAEGAYLWDVDGNRYTDFLLAYGTIILGHADPRVTAAVVEEIGSGFATGLMKPVQAQLAKRLVEMTPGADLALFLKTGSDATSAAVRLARAHTGRDRVVRWGYNGWHDWCATRPAGIPAATRELTTRFEPDDLDALDHVLRADPGGVACIVMMPFEVEPPTWSFLADVRRLADDHGALLVFDEMRSGFRVGIPGVQGREAPAADLVTYGKALANGYALSTLVGRRDVMERLADCHISSTFYVNSAAMAAALATLDVLETTPVLDHIRHLGERLQAGLRDLAGGHGVPARVRGVPQMPFLTFEHADQEARRAAQRAFYTTTIRAGTFFHPNHHWYICGATTESDIDRALEASADGFAAITRPVVTA